MLKVITGFCKLEVNVVPALFVNVQENVIPGKPLLVYELGVQAELSVKLIVLPKQATLLVALKSTVAAAGGTKL